MTNDKRKEKIMDFLKNPSKKILILDRNKKYGAVSEWWRIRTPLKVPLNFIVIQLCKLCPSMKLKRVLLRGVGIKIGKNVSLAPSHFDSVFPELISIEEYSIIGNKVHIMTHEFTRSKIRLGKVHIGKNVLIGAFSVIRSGVNIGENSTVSMFSLVNKDIPSNELWGGIPAKKISKLK